MGDKTLLWIDPLLDILHYITIVHTLQLALYILRMYVRIHKLSPIILAFVHCVCTMVRQQLGNTDLKHCV